ncbi:MAG: polyribonucleotide nucleotidyltransferase [Candidatus Omnitrophica bacterium]|nr:polyribonucleotide nucleotidyltransferase [Candidatus Omnitrophota bacterium]
MEEVRTKIGMNDLVIETGKMAKQADGSVTVTCGGTMVLVTSVCSAEPREGLSFFPLTVEYREKTFAAGKIPGGFFKREGRPSQKETLTSRMIDRPIRPLFPDGMTNEVQVIASVLSSDGKTDSDVLALIGASASLTISDIPFEGPLGAVRVGLVGDELVLNPSFAQVEESELDLVVVGNSDSVIMLEAGAQIVSEEKLLEAIRFGHEHMQPMIKAQVELKEKVGKPKREDIAVVSVDEDVMNSVSDKAKSRLKEVMTLEDKQKRSEGRKALVKELIAAEENEEVHPQIKKAVGRLEKEILREVVLREGRRIDGRKFDEIRSLTSEINVLPGTHGSGLFTRGETQSLAVTTLGTAADEQRVDALEGEFFKSFMLHYNFPPFSVGETRPMRGPGRREIGHGALAEKALSAVIPAKESFPYTIRLVSEILESNGSSSMATVCAGSLSLMASGVPVKTGVSGIAMGLITGEGKHHVLTDIAGAEDHFGDMDFKVAGTGEGVTAVQMDLKVEGISFDILKEAFDQARKARLEILDNMKQAIAEPLPEVAPNAPRIVTIMVKTEKIRDVIGSGGKVIRQIIADTGADINIEDDGTCQVASSDKESLDKAVAIIEGIIEEPEVGRVYDATVKNITSFGCFVEFLPKQEGLVHVSELANEYVKEVSEVVSEGDKVRVKLIGIDDQGRVKLSMKQVDSEKSEEDNT